MFDSKHLIERLRMALICMIAFGSGKVVASPNTESTTFSVQAQVVASCSISVTNLVFPNYTFEETNGESTGAVRCTTGTNWSIGLNAGVGVGATVQNRKMTGPGGTTLDYNLYVDDDRTVYWGNTPGVDTKNGIAVNSQWEDFIIYGKISEQQSQDPVIGHYTDTITATVTFN